MAAQLAFKADWIEPIQSGQKRQTLRKQSLLEEGDVVGGEVQLDQAAVRHAARDERGGRPPRRSRGRDATADGFESVREMLDWLDGAYGPLDEFTRISFVVEGGPAARSGT